MTFDDLCLSNLLKIALFMQNVLQNDNNSQSTRAFLKAVVQPIKMKSVQPITLDVPPRAQMLPENTIRNGLAIDQEIFERIHRAILEQRLPPGTQLTEERLSEVFSVSRARIRRVLLRLAESKAVLMQPNRGAFVAQPTPKEVSDVFDARRVLEAQVVRDAVANMTPNQRRQLEHHLDLEREAHDQGRLHTAIRLTGEFHLLLAEVAGNETISRFLSDLVAHTSLAMTLYGDSTRPACGEDEHELLLEAIAEGRTAQALELMEAHLSSIEEWLRFTSFQREMVDILEVFAD
jgi:DNA-binding GntR family transcriptional regulator